MIRAYHVIVRNLFRIDGVDAAMEVLRENRLPPSVELSEYVLRILAQLGLLDLDDSCFVERYMIRRPDLVSRNIHEFRTWMYMCLLEKHLRNANSTVADRALLFSLLTPSTFLPVFGTNAPNEWPCKLLPCSNKELSHLVNLLDFDMPDPDKKPLVAEHVANCVSGLHILLWILTGSMAGTYEERASNLESTHKIQCPEILTRYGMFLLRVATQAKNVGLPLPLAADLRSDAAKFISLGEFSEVIPCPRGVRVQTMTVLSSAWGGVDVLKETVRTTTLTGFSDQIKHKFGRSPYLPTKKQIEKVYSTLRK
jgi:hypothetical protein